jgi:hypothetical protein
MGGDPHGGEAPACLGNDVVDLLNDVFGDQSSDKYKYARGHNQFGGVGTDYNMLIQAYETAFKDVKVNGRWAAYLRKLHSIDPNNISTIASFRYNNLTSNAGMSTILHEPVHGGHVHTQPGGGAAPAVINSPFPLPDNV